MRFLVGRRPQKYKLTFYKSMLNSHKKLVVENNLEHSRDLESSSLISEKVKDGVENLVTRKIVTSTQWKSGKSFLPCMI